MKFNYKMITVKIKVCFYAHKNMIKFDKFNDHEINSVACARKK